MKTGFNAAEIFRKYLWYLLRERKFDTEAVSDVVQLKASLQLSDEEVRTVTALRAWHLPFALTLQCLDWLFLCSEPVVWSVQLMPNPVRFSVRVLCGHHMHSMHISTHEVMHGARPVMPCTVMHTHSVSLALLFAA